MDKYLHLVPTLKLPKKIGLWRCMLEKVILWLTELTLLLFTHGKLHYPCVTILTCSTRSRVQKSIVLYDIRKEELRRENEISTKGVIKAVTHTAETTTLADNVLGSKDAARWKSLRIFITYVRIYTTNYDYVTYFIGKRVRSVQVNK